MATIRCNAWPQIALPLFTAGSRLMFGLWWLDCWSSQHFKEGWELMWVHMMLMGGCGRAARPSYCTKQGPVKMLWCTPFKNTHRPQMLVCSSHCWNTTDPPSPTSSTFLSPTLLSSTQKSSHPHEQAYMRECKIMKYLRLHGHTQIHTGPGGTDTSFWCRPHSIYLHSFITLLSRAMWTDWDWDFE